MNKMNKRMLAVAVSAILSGCGGGGGGGSGATNGAPAQTVTASPAVQLTPLNTTVPTPTYPAGSFQLGFFNALNQVRGSMGLGLVAQDTRLDTAAQHHADYNATNYTSAMNEQIDPSTGLLYAHSEDVGKPLYYAATPQARDTLAGYQNTTGEVAGPTSWADTYGGTSAFNALMSTIYHRSALLTELPRYIGIGVNPTLTSPGVSGWSVEDTGYVPNPALLPPGTLLTYPAGGGVDNYPYWSNAWEQPIPLPSVPATQPLGGGISVQVPTYDNLAVTSFTLTDSIGNNVPVYQENAATDTSGYFWGNFAFIVPQSPLTPGTTYTASFVGTDTNQAGTATTVSRTWTFSTPPNTVTVTTAGPYVVHNGGSITIASNVPSGYITYTYSGAPAGFSSAGDGDSAIIFSLAPGSVTASSNVTVTISDAYYPSTPSATITLTVAP